jgi:hypothetical protein
MSTSVVQLGQLEMVDLRKAWPDEAANFTPWLAEAQNLALPGESLGMELELASVEQMVGTFKADILARDAETRNWVLIENQLTKTDHSHLGQIVTYAAGLDAKTIVWIAEVFRDEHLAAIEFLNRATGDEYSFFAVEIELFKIGGSAPAPRFSVAAKPNTWNKQGQIAKAESDGASNQALNQEYWGTLIAAAGKYPALAIRKPYKYGYQAIEGLRGGDPAIWLNACFSIRGLRLELNIDGSTAKRAFQELKRQRGEIEAGLGSPLEWEELPQARMSRIALYMPGAERRENRDRWNDQHRWILTNAPKLANAVRPFVATLQPDQLRQAPLTELGATSAGEDTPGGASS